MSVLRRPGRAGAIFVVWVITAFLLGCHPTPSTFDTVDIKIQTGNDNAESRLQVAAWISGKQGGGHFCLKPSDDSDFRATPACPNAAGMPSTTWPNGFVFDSGPMTLENPIPVASLASTHPLIVASQSAVCSSNCDNWDLQAITVTFSDSSGKVKPSTPLNLGSFIQSGWNDQNCLARLKAPPNATTVQFTLETNQHIYQDGTPSELGATTTCKNNGD